MSERLKDFLIDISEHDDARQRFIRDPDGEMQRAGLSRPEIEAVRKADPKEIKRLFKETGVVLQSIVCLVYLPVIAPGAVGKPPKRGNKPR